MQNVDQKLASMIDHTLLKANATRAEIKKICSEAVEYGFKTVCVNPYYVSLAANILQGSQVEVCTVIGFPLGANSSDTKAYEVKKAVQDGATELDMVINIGALKSGDYAFVKRDIQQVIEAAQGRLVKVIFETCLLKELEKVQLAKICYETGADFLKTSTGFSTGGATKEDVKLLKQIVPMKVKAAGGIKTRAQALEFVEAGADRIGASAGINLVLL
jgi:deoxyribose-phosphate aldolase